ncbi:3-deoxy-D-manno-octulosonic acid transferase [Aliiroseovarius sp. YM-037]|uniref:3-deoxy-D-manno-octulosonic acid transferase n=1 Tax=Aliiroseovarius sp. YM-037 TaxID=3341728 RepID=UPI003A7FEE03
MARSLRRSFLGALRGRRNSHQDSATPAPRKSEGASLVWCHSTTVTQAAAFAELILRLSDDLRMVEYAVTTPDAEVAATLKTMLPEDVFVRHLPRDDDDFVNEIKPDLVIWTNPSEHAATLAELSNRNVPMILTDARIPQNRPLSQLIPGAQRTLLSRFDHILAADEETERWIVSHSIAPEAVEVLGEMQEGTIALHCNEAERDTLAQLLAARPVWLAACCTQEEEDIVLAAHRQALRVSHRLLLILVPDDGESGPRIMENFEAVGLNTVCRSTGGEPDDDRQVYVADTDGEMGLWYRLAPISFLGRSLAPGRGAINPYEPAALGSAILHGPNTGIHTPAFERLTAAGAARLVKDDKELAKAVQDLLAPDQAAAMAHGAWIVTSGGSQIIDRLAEMVAETLDAERQE